ncbi:MAG: DUF1592 domain-containing protein [Acidobacteriota bacterium]
MTTSVSYRVIAGLVAVWCAGSLSASGVSAAVGRPARAQSASPASPDGSVSSSPRPAVPASAAESRLVLDRYCVGCHNERLKTGGLALDGIDLAQVPRDGGIWEKVIRKLHSGTMPPQGVPRPEQATLSAVIGWLEGELDRNAARSPNPGRPVLHRLNRTEYANVIRDLLALDVDVSSLLPPDDSSYGFDNIADVLRVSPALLEQYLTAARKISALAVGDPEIVPASDTYRVRHDLSQDRHVEGLPLGTVGGTLVRHNVPLDGEYVLQVKLFRTNLAAIRGLEYPHQVEISVDGQRVFLANVGGTADFLGLFDNPKPYSDLVDARLQVRLNMTAGPHEIGAAFLQKALSAGTAQLQPFIRSSADPLDFTGRPHIETLTITGPSMTTGPGDTPSRRRIFSCRPSNRISESRCAEQILSTLGRRAYRQPLTDSDVRRLLEFYQAGRQKGTFEAGIQLALRRMLASPKFVFRAEQEPANAASGAVYRVSDTELASRLSFFLWSSIPDDELLDAAKHGTLGTPVVLERQVRRMLADSRADALVTNFSGQWLQLRNLRNIQPDSESFPDFDDNLRQAFQRETELFLGSIVHDDRNVLDLFSADYTFVNERLARHYGMPGIYGSHFRRVHVANEARRGLLGQGSMLTVTSHTDRTSPVLRGKWILDNILGMPPPAPPAVVPALKESDDAGKPLTMRAQMEMHRANATCAACHRMMDPPGFALENFDAIGAWRTGDSGGPIDASAQMGDGSRITGAVGLRQALLSRPELIVGTITEKLLTYALGRGVESYDMPSVRAIGREAARSQYKFSSLVLGIVKSTPFQMRVVSRHTPN